MQDAVQLVYRQIILTRVFINKTQIRLDLLIKRIKLLCNFDLLDCFVMTAFG